MVLLILHRLQGVLTLALVFSADDARGSPGRRPPSQSIGMSGARPSLILLTSDVFPPLTVRTELSRVRASELQFFPEFLPITIKNAGFISFPRDKCLCHQTNYSFFRLQFSTVSLRQKNNEPSPSIPFDQCNGEILGVMCRDQPVIGSCHCKGGSAAPAIPVVPKYSP